MRSLQFTVQSPPSVVGSRQAILSDNVDRRKENGVFAQVLPNPVSNTLRLLVNEAKGQNVNVHLVDVTGRTLLQRVIVPEAQSHLEEFEVSQLSGGMYLLWVTAGEKHVTLKVIKAD